MLNFQIKIHFRKKFSLQLSGSSYKYPILVCFRNITDTYSTGRQIFDTTGVAGPSQSSASSVRGKVRQGRPVTRGNRVIQQVQQQQEQQQNSYSQNSQVVTYEQQPQRQQQQQQQSFSMELQSVRQLNPNANQVQVELNSLNDGNQVSGQMTNQNLVTGSSSYVQQTGGSGSSQTQPRAIRPLPSVVSTQQQQSISDSFKLVQSSQGYKFTAPVQGFNPQQCKFRTSGFKVH